MALFTRKGSGKGTRYVPADPTAPGPRFVKTVTKTGRAKYLPFTPTEFTR